MRFVVLLFGFVGVLLTGALGYALLEFKQFEDIVREMVMPGGIDFLRYSIMGIPHNDTAAMLFLAAAYGFLGSLLAFFRCGKQGGALLLVPIVFVTVMHPYTIAFTGLQAFAGLLSLFISPLPINAKPTASDDEEDDEDD